MQQRVRYPNFSDESSSKHEVLNLQLYKPRCVCIKCQARIPNITSLLDDSAPHNLFSAPNFSASEGFVPYIYPENKPLG